MKSHYATISTEQPREVRPQGSSCVVREIPQAGADGAGGDPSSGWRRQPRFAPLASFLERVPDQCPHALFRASARASQTAAAFIADNKRIAIPKENTATRMAALVLPTTGDNHARHAALQRFMLANDLTTIEVEVPIWLHAEDIAAIERRWGIELSPQAATAPSEGEARSITGHIDFLQIRNGAIHILDYEKVVDSQSRLIPVLCGLREHHISADVAYAVWQYWQATLDDDFFHTR